MPVSLFAEFSLLDIKYGAVWIRDTLFYHLKNLPDVMEFKINFCLSIIKIRFLCFLSNY